MKDNLAWGEVLLDSNAIQAWMMLEAVVFLPVASDGVSGLIEVEICCVSLIMC